MKVFISLVCLLFAAIALHGQQFPRYTYHDGDKSQLKEIFHVIDTFSNVLEGPYRSYYLNGNIESLGQFANNETVGVWEFYYVTGKLKMRGALKNNSNYGNWEYFYENGNKQMEGKIINRMREGPWKTYYESGELKSEGNFNADRRTGIWKIYYEDGRLKGENNYTSDKGTSIEYYSTGEKKAEGEVLGLKSAGHWKYYYKSGKLQAEGEFINGNRSGEWTYYHPEGTISSRGEFVSDNPEGNWKYYHVNGTLSAEGNFTNGEKEGIWNAYYTNGNLKSTTIHKDESGQYEEYYDSGQIKIKGTLVDGVKHGKWYYYFEDGTLEGEADFDFGHGIYKGFYQDGTLYTKGTVENDLRTGTWEIYDTSGTLQGYYKPYYVNDSLTFNSLKVDKPERRYGIAGYGFNKKKFHYFNPRYNEFEGLIISANPLMSFIGEFPVGIEIYLQERLGYELLFEGMRDPFFTENERISLNTLYLRGYNISFRQKFYNPDGLFGMFYFGHSLSYGSINHFVNNTDENTNLLVTYNAQEKKYLYNLIAGYRLMPSTDSRGFTMDGFVSIGTGYRTFHTDKQDEDFFDSLPKDKIPLDFNFGVTFGYVYPF